MGEVVELDVFREKKKAEQDEKFLNSRMPDFLRESVDNIRQIAATAPTGSAACFLSEALAGAWEDWYRVLPDVQDDLFREHTQLLFQPLVNNDAEVTVRYVFAYGDSDDPDEAESGSTYEACKIAVTLEKKSEASDEFRNEYQPTVNQMSQIAQRVDELLEGEHAGAGGLTFPIFSIIDRFERKGLQYTVQRTWKKDRVFAILRHEVDNDHVMTMTIDIFASALKNAYSTLRELHGI